MGAYGRQIANSKYCEMSKRMAWADGTITRREVEQSPRLAVHMTHAPH